MERKRLGRTDMWIAPIVFGGNVFGWTADEKTSFDLLDRFREAGFNAIDTADSYTRGKASNVGGESETIIGRWMKSRRCRDEMVIITKVGSDMGSGKRDLSAPYIQQAIEASLRRLQTDRVDVYMSHWPVGTISYGETLGAYQRLIEAGKIRACGASNLDAGQLAEALKVAADGQLPRYEVIEPAYNLYDRSIFENELRELCVTQELGVVSYYALARGFLTGKYRCVEDCVGPRGDGMIKYLDERGHRILAALDRIASRRNVRPAEVALAWVIARPAITAPIASATSLAQFESFERAVSLKLDDAEMEELSHASA